MNAFARSAMGGVVLMVLVGCSSSSSSPSGSSSSGGSSGSSSSSSSGGATACTVTFGQDAASVQSTSCSVLGPFDGSGVTAWTFNGNATGLDGTSTYSFTLKYASPTQTKTYQTADHYYISDNISVTSTGKIYSVDFDSQDNTKERDGSAVTTLSSAGHGTIDLVLDSSDAPPAHASVHIAF